MRTTLRAAKALTAFASVLIVAACASPPETTAPVVPPVVSAPSSTATSVEPSRLPALKDLKITPAGIGSLQVGQPVSQTDMIVFDADFCGPVEGEEVAYYEDGSPVEYGRWVANYTADGGAPFHADADDGMVSVIEVRNDLLSTAEGVHVGSSLVTLTTAYPALVPGIEGSMSKTLVLATGEGDMTFEVSTREYGSYPSNTVIDIRIYPAGQHQRKVVAGTDDVVGGCL